MITEEIKEHLMSKGLTKQQVNSATTEALFNILMNEDGKSLIQEARLQVIEMQNLVSSLREEYRELKKKIEGSMGLLLDMAKAQEEYGHLTDERARNALFFYAAMLKMNIDAGANGSEAVEHAGYDFWSFFGGQARRDIHYDKPQDDDD